MAGGKHHYSSTFALTFQGPRTKSATMESESWEGWELTKTSDTEIVPPLGVGRHDGLEFFGYGAGSYCGDGFGGGGSSPFGFGQPVSLHFEMPLHPRRYVASAASRRDMRASWRPRRSSSFIRRG